MAVSAAMVTGRESLKKGLASGLYWIWERRTSILTERARERDSSTARRTAAEGNSVRLGQGKKRSQGSCRMRKKGAANTTGQRRNVWLNLTARRCRREKQACAKIFDEKKGR